MGIPRIRGTQIGLRDSDLVDRLKADMSAGRYFFQEARGQIGGVIDPRGDHHVIDGHHRMAAALEIFRETGDDNAVRMLVVWGWWGAVEKAPSDSRPFPVRWWWGAFRNWLGF
jgi:filamentous hemagglutinin